MQSIWSFPNQLIFLQANSSFSLCRYVNRNYRIKEIKRRNCQSVYQCELELESTFTLHLDCWNYTRRYCDHVPATYLGLYPCTVLGYDILLYICCLHSAPPFLRSVTSPSLLPRSTSLLGGGLSSRWSSPLLQWVTTVDSSRWPVIMARCWHLHWKVSSECNSIHPLCRRYTYTHTQFT